MINVLLLVVCFLAGMGFRITGRFPESTPAALNAFIIHVSLPALAIYHIHNARFDSSLILSVSMPWALFFAGLGFFILAGRVLKLPRETVGALALACGLGNTSFVGIPMIEAYYGQNHVATGLLIDQFGTFMALSTVGIAVAAYCSAGKATASQMARRILFFPPFVALLAALILRSVDFPTWLPEVLKRLGDTLAPLALFSVGYQLRLGQIREEAKPLAAGLFFKLALAPALMALLYAGAFGMRGATFQVTIFEAAMAPMITGGIVAAEHGLNKRLVTVLLGVGIPLSFITLPLWWRILEGF